MSTEIKEANKPLLESYDDIENAVVIWVKSDESNQPMINPTEHNIDIDIDDEDEYGTEMIIELPRDILTAYILTRLGGRWKLLSRTSKICVLFGLIASYAIQFAVFFSFIGDLDFDNFRVGDTTAKDFWFNLIAIATLFIYLWRDVIMFYNSVWFWIGRVEKEKNFSTFSKLKNIKNISKGIKQIKNIKNIGNVSLDNIKALSIQNIRKHSYARKIYEGSEFWQFRLALISVFILYGGYALYSLIAIGNTNTGLIEKMDVAIQIFFVLEIDDWACALFILGPGVLDDDEFDVSIVLNETNEDSTKRIQRRLLATTLLLMFSIIGVYILSNYKVIFDI
eukprot:519900_1